MVDAASERALTSLLATVRLRATIFGASELTAPWGVSTGPLPSYACYVVPKGSAVLVARGVRRALTISAGGVALVRAGVGHELKDSPATRAVPFERLRAKAGDTALFRNGGAGARTRIICGMLELDDPDRALFDTAFPKTVILTSEDLSEATRHLIAALASEATHRNGGTSLVLTRLAEVLFLQVVRACAARDVRATGWLRGIGHPAIARALTAIHDAPEEAWTLERLASKASMSRSTFASTFRSVVGEPPFAYVTAWRMRNAARSLASSDESVKAIAAAAGYGSDEAFSRAFRAWAGVPPGAYRAQSRARERQPDHSRRELQAGRAML
ncbi:MAG: AraC family transcriptional regulator [Polyangiaceae bacterium]|nr:AraC family transcriptional regulator [Polyangiaceae bacterium]